MEKKKLIIPEPQAPCPECVGKSLGRAGSLIWTHCEHNLSGGILYYWKGEPAEWHIVNPITFDNFLKHLETVNLSLERIMSQGKQADEALGAALEAMPIDKIGQS